MSAEPVYVLSVAGFDPSGGAGILADIKTLEANKVGGMGVVSALTFQNDSEFDGVNWMEAETILKQIHTLQRKFSFNCVKIGIIKDLQTLEAVVDDLIAHDPGVRIIWDPVISASAGFEFHQNFESEKLFSLLQKIFLVTPNTAEAEFLTGMADPKGAAQKLVQYCNVLLKGGHNDREPGVDYLFSKKGIEKFVPGSAEVYQKHGSGCVLSSSIAAQLALGNDLPSACRNAKNYTERFLSSNKTLLGVHYA